MRSISTAHCITRVVVDGSQQVELVELDAVMAKILAAVRDVVPPSEQRCVGNALLNLAVCRMLREMDSERAATILLRLAGSVLDHERPPRAAHAVDLTSTHS